MSGKGYSLDLSIIFENRFNGILYVKKSALVSKKALSYISSLSFFTRLLTHGKSVSSSTKSTFLSMSFSKAKCIADILNRPIRCERSIFHQYVHIALRVLLSTGEGAKQPCFHNGLGLEIFGYHPCHCRCVHRYSFIVLFTKIQHLFHKQRISTQ